MALTTGSNTGTQTATGSPQSTTTDSGLAGTPSSGVQPGTASNVLNAPAGTVNGVPLGQAQLSTVSLNTTTVAVTNAPRPAVHHINWGMFSISGLLLVAAIVLFWSMNRSAVAEKNTTK